ncbi:MAG: LysR substrate-binding domain-containing protein, partial [Peptococcaceae bacterium]
EQLQKNYPYIEVSIFNNMSEDTMHLISSKEEADVLGILTTSGEHDPVLDGFPQNLSIKQCFAEEVVLAIAKNHRLDRQGVVSLEELQGETFIHCTSQKLDVTPSNEVFAPVKNEMKHIYCNSISLWGKMIGNGLGIGPIMKRALHQAFLEGELDRNRVSSVTIDTKPLLYCNCVYRTDAPQYVKKIVSEIAKI